MIKRFLEWALSKFEPTPKELVKAQLFPAANKRKPRAATTRTSAAKTVAKKTTKVTKKAT